CSRRTGRQHPMSIASSRARSQAICLSALPARIAPTRSTAARWGLPSMPQSVAALPLPNDDCVVVAALGLDLGQRLAAAIDLTPEPTCFLAPRTDRPVGEAADGEPALAASTGTIVEDERATARDGDAGGIALDGRVPG